MLTAINNTVSSTIDYDDAVTSATAELRWVAANELHVDHNYQRTLRPMFIRKIVKEFDPLLLGVLYVSERADGTLWVIDGQHRLEAVLSVYPLMMMHCIVYQGLDSSDEARLFWLMQKNRRGITAMEQFVSRVHARDPKALDIMRAMTEANVAPVTYKVANDQMRLRSSRAFAALEQVFDWMGHEGLVDVLTVIGDAWESERDAFRADHVLGVGVLLRRFPNLDRKRLVTKMRAVPPADIRREAKRQESMSIVSMRHGESVARALSMIYNRGLRNDGNRISWEG